MYPPTPSSTQNLNRKPHTAKRRCLPRNRDRWKIIAPDAGCLGCLVIWRFVFGQYVPLTSDWSPNGCKSMHLLRTRRKRTLWDNWNNLEFKEYCDRWSWVIGTFLFSYVGHKFNLKASDRLVVHVDSVLCVAVCCVQRREKWQLHIQGSYLWILRSASNINRRNYEIRPSISQLTISVGCAQRCTHD